MLKIEELFASRSYESHSPHCRRVEAPFFEWALSKNSSKATRKNSSPWSYQLCTVSHPVTRRSRYLVRKSSLISWKRLKGSSERADWRAERMFTKCTANRIVICCPIANEISFTEFRFRIRVILSVWGPENPKSLFWRSRPSNNKTQNISNNFRNLFVIWSLSMGYRTFSIATVVHDGRRHIRHRIEIYDFCLWRLIDRSFKINWCASFVVWCSSAIPFGNSKQTLHAHSLIQLKRLIDTNETRANISSAEHVAGAVPFKRCNECLTMENPKLNMSSWFLCSIETFDTSKQNNEFYSHWNYFGLNVLRSLILLLCWQHLVRLILRCNQF